MKQSLTALLIFTLGISHAQDTLSLEAAIRLGLENNYQIQIAEKQLQIDRNNNSWGNAGAYPSLTLGSTLSGSKDLETPINSDHTLIVNPSVKLNWVIFNGFNIRIAKDKLAYYEQVSEGNTAIMVENTIQSILLSYHLVQLQQQALEVYNTVKKLSWDRYTYQLERKELGNAVSFDVLQAQNNYLADSAGALRQEINYRNALRNLNLILAEPVEKEYLVTGNMPAVDSSYVLADLIKKLESDNESLRNQYINQEILRKNVGQSISGLYPMLSLSAGIDRSITGVYGNPGNYQWDNGVIGTGATLNLSYTLSNGGNIRRAIRNAKLSEEMGSLRLEEMKQSLYNQLFSILEQYDIRRQLLHVAEARIKAAKLNLQIGTDKYRAGAINSFNYRDIQLLYQNAALEELQAKYNLIDSWSELLRLTGGIITQFQ